MQNDVVERSPHALRRDRIPSDQVTTEVGVGPVEHRLGDPGRDAEQLRESARSLIGVHAKKRELPNPDPPAAGRRHLESRVDGARRRIREHEDLRARNSQAASPSRSTGAPGSIESVVRWNRSKSPAEKDMRAQPATTVTRRRNLFGYRDNSVRSGDRVNGGTRFFRQGYAGRWRAALFRAAGATSDFRYGFV